MEPTVRPLRTHELRNASRLLAGAFSDDPFIRHFLRDRRRREVAFPRFFRAALHELAGAGTVFALEADRVLTGVAAWAARACSPDLRRSKCACCSRAPRRGC